MSDVPPFIAAALAAEGGRMTFARFMDVALTSPDGGYYTSRAPILGPGGDFSTAPRMVPAFNRMVARILAEVVDAVAGEEPVLVAEVGPGEGDLAAAIFSEWTSERPDLQGRVVLRLVDVPGGLAEVQRGVAAELTRVGWEAAWAPGPPGPAGLGLRRLPAAGVVFTNELLDALPVHRLDIRGTHPRECWVKADGGSLVEEWDALSPAATDELALLFPGADLEALRRCSRDGQIELRPGIGRFVDEWAGAFAELCVVTIDYGEWRLGPAGPAEAWPCDGGASGDGPVAGETDRAPAPAWVPRMHRHERTVRGYAHHVRQADLYRSPGGQDLTADVDFRALAVHGGRRGLECIGYTTLAGALAGLGGREEAERLRASAATSLDDDMALTVLEGLLDPDGVGGLFKVMIQAS